MHVRARRLDDTDISSNPISTKAFPNVFSVIEKQGTIAQRSAESDAEINQFVERARTQGYDFTQIENAVAEGKQRGLFTPLSANPYAPAELQRRRDRNALIGLSGAG